MRNKMMNRIIGFGLLASVFTGCATEDNDSAEVANDENTEMSDGIYSSTVPGMIAPIDFEIEIKDNKLEAITVIDEKETAGVGEIALNETPAKIIENQSVQVDTVSGATITSFAVINAVKDSIEQAGGNVSDFEIPVEEVVDTQDEYTADVVIVGGGGAGLGAAVSAIDEGASVVLIEKMGYLGGNSIVSGGIYNTPDPEAQDYLLDERSDSLESLITEATSEEPVNDEHEELMDVVKKEYKEYQESDKTLFDSPNWFALQTWNGGDKVADLDMVKVLTSNSLETLNWFKDSGATFGEAYHGGGALYPRTQKTVSPNGIAFIDAYKSKIEDNENYTELLNVSGESLIIEDGKVVGVVATDKSGKEIKLNANNGVVLTTGGFAGSVELRQEYAEGEKWPDLGPDIVNSNMPGVTGDGIFMAQDAGAELVNMDQIQLIPYTNPQTGALYDVIMGVGSNLFINKEGERFVREDGRRDEMAIAIIEQTDGMMYKLLSGDGIPDPENQISAGGQKLTYYLENNVAGWVSGDTLAELAEKIDVPAEALEQAVEEFNNAVELEEADSFGRVSYQGKFITPPFYAYPRKPSVHHTMGGVLVDEETRVLAEDGSIIEGLYAAGEITGNLHGANRLGGNAIVDFAVFGNIAGISAANAK